MTHSHRDWPRRRNRRWGRTRAYLIASAVAVVIIGGGAWWMFSGKRAEASAAPLPAKVVEASFDYTLVEQGEVESSVNVDIRCFVKSRNAGGTDILWVVPDGSIVEPGQELVRLDKSALEQERDQQKIVCNTSLATKVQAENAYKAAVIARTEYLEGTFQQEKLTIEGEIFVAEENLRRAAQYAEFSEFLAVKGYQTKPQLEADRFAVSKAKSDLELAKRKLSVLQEYTREKMLRTLESDIATTKAKWDTEEESYKLEQKKLADVEEQIALCTIKAPQAGQVVYANIPNSRGGTAEFIVEPGAKVREGQAILRMPDTKKMQVRAKINESRINSLRPGLPVSIRIDALGESRLTGVIKRINSFAEPTGFFGSTVKQYATEITIENPPENIRTGLTAECTIHIEHMDSALQVPVQSIIEHGGKTWCLLQEGDQWTPQEVVIGSTNDKFIRIESGLSAAQTIAANPRQHLNLFPFIKEGRLQQPGPTLPPGTKIAAAPRGADGDKKSGGDSKKGNGRPSPAQMFAQLDADSDGKLTAAELEAIPAGLRERLGNPDANGDGHVDSGELTAAMAKARSSGGGGAGGASGRGGPELAPSSGGGAP